MIISLPPTEINDYYGGGDADGSFVLSHEGACFSISLYFMC